MGFDTMIRVLQNPNWAVQTLPGEARLLGHEFDPGARDADLDPWACGEQSGSRAETGADVVRLTNAVAGALLARRSVAAVALRSETPARRCWLAYGGSLLRPSRHKLDQEEPPEQGEWAGRDMQEPAASAGRAPPRGAFRGDRWVALARRRLHGSRVQLAGRCGRGSRGLDPHLAGGKIRRRLGHCSA